MCGGPAACALEAAGFALSLSFAVGFCSDTRMRWKKPIWGREARRSLLLLLFWCLSCCHFRSHSCRENIVADTQQDDLLAVIHGEAGQTGFLPSPPLVAKLTYKVQDTTDTGTQEVVCFLILCLCVKASVYTFTQRNMYPFQLCGRDCPLAQYRWLPFPMGASYRIGVWGVFFSLQVYLLLSCWSVPLHTF